MLQTHQFHAFSTVHTNRRLVCVFVVIYFQESFQIDAFSMKTLGVLGLNASKCMRFQTKKHLVWTRLFLTKIWSQKPQETPPLSPSSVIASENIQEQQNYVFPEGPVFKNCQEPLCLLELPNTVAESLLYLLPFDFFFFR